MHETVWTILTDPNHLAAEVIVDIGIGICELPLIWAYQRYHDRRHHPISLVDRFSMLKRGVGADKGRVR